MCSFFSALNCSSKTPAHTHWTLINLFFFIWGVCGVILGVGGGGWVGGGWVGGSGWEGRTTLVALTLVQSSLFFLFFFGLVTLSLLVHPSLVPPPPPPNNHSFSSDGVYSLRHKW